MGGEQPRRILDYIRDVAVPSVREHGWHVHGHTLSARKLGGNITYTVGLTEAALPELAVAGLPHTAAAVILNDCARSHLRNELVAGARRVSAAGATLEVVAAPGVVGPLARAMYGARVRFLQLVWACPDGHFPGDAAWRPVDHPAQPVYDVALDAGLLPAGDGVVDRFDETARGGW